MVRLTSIRCPQCHGETKWEGNPNRPFCSERCRLLDLGAWANEEYRLPGEKAPDEEPED
ncbi:MAG TPA: DNA gyrase inhibitor YacG [Geobacteraceae bacterium]|nr:DNA gyrase inhibitor YacG [Geobacteraceae bacterium]